MMSASLPSGSGAVRDRMGASLRRGRRITLRFLLGDPEGSPKPPASPRVAHLSEAETREAVQEALDALPDELAAQLGGVAVIVEDRHPDGLMGIYDPVGGIQRIVIFRDANPTRDEVKRTVWHEVGHYFGMDEDYIEQLGYG